MIKCRFEDGEKAQLRHVVVDAIIIRDHEVLLAKRAPSLTHGNKYCLPGGYISRDETIEQAVLREVREETGYKTEISNLFYINDNPQRGDNRQNIAFVYIVKVLKKVGQPDNESTQVKWFDLNKLPKPEKFAFDHFKTIQLFQQYLKQSSPHL